MGVGLYLQGSFSPPAGDNPVQDWFNQVSEWFDDAGIVADKPWGNLLIECQTGKTHNRQPALLVAIHPAGEDVEFIVPVPGQLIVSAKTSTVGPGYHTALCRLVG